MKKTTSIIAGVTLMTAALCMFSTENMWAAGAGTACLLFAFICFRYAENKK